MYLRHPTKERDSSGQAAFLRCPRVRTVIGNWFHTLNFQLCVFLQLTCLRSQEGCPGSPAPATLHSCPAGFHFRNESLTWHHCEWSSGGKTSRRPKNRKIPSRDGVRPPSFIILMERMGRQAWGQFPFTVSPPPLTKGHFWGRVRGSKWGRNGRSAPGGNRPRVSVARFAQF